MCIEWWLLCCFPLEYHKEINFTQQRINPSPLFEATLYLNPLPVPSVSLSGVCQMHLELDLVWLFVCLSSGSELRGVSLGEVT